MDTVQQFANSFQPKTNMKARASLLGVLLLLSGLCAGCAAVTNPIADGIPVRLLPSEILGPCKTHYETIPLNALEQTQPDDYRLDVGDVLGVYVESFLGEKNVPLPVHVAPLVNTPGLNRLAPGAGYPITVEQDGSITLPAVPKLAVKGMTVGEANDAVRNLYVKQNLLRNENARVLVTLLHQRQHQVLVFRQEAQSFLAGQDGPVPISKRNTGHLVDLPAYQNDVLHALVRTGGLPELDAYNEIIIYRDAGKDRRTAIQKQIEKAKPGVDPVKLAGGWVGETVRLPLRLPCGSSLPFSKEDVVLNNGDVLFLEARDEEVFFTAGLLPPGKHMLPRDQDFDVIEAITWVRGPFYNGAFGGSNLSGNLIAPGLGSPSPSLLVVLRRVPGHGQVPIVVDLRQALLHPQERLVVRPGDLLVLQEKPDEAFGRYLTQTLFNFNILWNVFKSKSGVGVIDIAAPDRLGQSVGTFQIPP